MLNENINNLSPITETETETEIKTETPVTPVPKEPKNIKIHTPDFIYITGDQQKDEENLQNIISRSSGSLAKHSNSTITQKEFQRRFLLEKEAHKDFYGTNPYINAMHDNFIKKSI